LPLPLITAVGPTDGAPGTFVTIRGQDFGDTAGQVLFLGNPAIATDDILATAPSACSATRTWTTKQILVAVPSGAVSGPIKVIEATTGQNFWDDTNNERGWKGEFAINNTTRPGLCSVTDDFGAPGKAVKLRGIGFGPVQSGKVLFGEQAAAVTAWSPQEIAVVVPFLTPVQTTVAVNLGNQLSNPLAFRVDPSPVAAPTITSIDPPQGPPGQMITIRGTGFGREVGNVMFIRGNEQFTGQGLPAQCGLSGWTDTQIVSKIPAGLSANDQIKIYPSVRGEPGSINIVHKNLNNLNAAFRNPKILR